MNVRVDASRNASQAPLAGHLQNPMQLRDLNNLIQKALGRQVEDAARPRNWLLNLEEQATLQPWLADQANQLRAGYRADPNIRRTTIHAAAVKQKATYAVLQALRSAVHNAPVPERDFALWSQLDGMMVTDAHLDQLDRYSPGLTSFVRGIVA